MEIKEESIHFDDRFEAQEVVYGDHNDFKTVQEELVDDSGRWFNTFEIIVKHLETNNLYRAYFNRGATENQEEAPFEYDKLPIVFEQVYPKEVTIIQYFNKNNS